MAGKLANMTRADAGRMGAAAQGKATANLPMPQVSVAAARKLHDRGAADLVRALAEGGPCPSGRIGRPSPAKTSAPELPASSWAAGLGHENWPNREGWIFRGIGRRQSGKL